MQSSLPKCTVRAATLSDVDSIIAIKQALPPVDGGRGSGFILGSARELYCAWLETAVVKVLQVEQCVGGYAICLPDAILRQSELWQKKDRIAFSIPIASIVNEKIAYFEQLAVLPRYRRYVSSLLIAILDTVFAQGHLHLFATTVCEPFNNYAAQGLFKRGAAQTVGYLREHYPEHGTIVSQLHYVQQHDYQRARDAWCTSPSKEATFQ